jgi:hypothetical protein
VILAVGGRPTSDVQDRPLPARAALEALLDGDQRARLDVLRRALADRTADDGEPEEDGQETAFPPALDAAGDFDGDGRADVLARSLTADFDTLIASGRRGLDGRSLWSRRFDDFTTAGVLPVRAGEDGRGGVVAVHLPLGFEQPAPGGIPATVYDLPIEVEGIRGDGTTSWTGQVSGTYATADGVATVVDLPFSLRIADLLPGAAEDVVVFTLDATSANGSFALTRVAAHVLDGTTGRLMGLASYAPRDGRASDVLVDVVPDATGDGLDDLAFLEQTPFSTSTVTLHSGRDGLRRWTSRAMPYADDPGYERIGDVTGDTVPDVAVNLYEFFSGGTNGAYVLDGLTGLARYVAGDGVVYGAGDVDGDGVAEVGHASFRDDFDPEPRLVHVNALVDGDGTVLRSVEHSVPDGHYGLWETVGDVDGDGLVDAYLELYGTDYRDDEPRPVARRGMLIGRTGGLAWEQDPGDDDSFFTPVGRTWTGRATTSSRTCRRTTAAAPCAAWTERPAGCCGPTRRRTRGPGCS